MAERALSPIKDRNAVLETELIEEYIRSHGFEPQALGQRTDAAAHELRAKAVIHAGGILANHECRARLVQTLQQTHRRT